jgi:hypothetical protein
MNYEKNLDTNNKTIQMKLEKCSDTTLKELRDMNHEILEIIVKKYSKVNYAIPQSLQEELKNFNLDVHKIILGRMSSVLKAIL